MIQIEMEMPKNCYECPFAMHSYATLYGKGTKRIQGNYSCVLTHKAITTTKRNRFCPLKELVSCKDCKHRPKKDGYFNNVCPCATTGDPYLDWVPEDDWFCPEGER